MDISAKHLLSRRSFCLCCIGGAAAAGGWLAMSWPVGLSNRCPVGC
jgi:hypothetical protein